MIYNVDPRILECVDPETGEILDPERLREIEIEDKAEQLALLYKDRVAMASAIDGVIVEYERKKASALKSADWLKSYITELLAGGKLKTAKVTVSYHTSYPTIIDDDAALKAWAQENLRTDLLKYAEPTVSKTAVRKALDQGETIPGVRVVKAISTVIK